jgi:hypothetical protein
VGRGHAEYLGENLEKIGQLCQLWTAGVRRGHPLSDVDIRFFFVTERVRAPAGALAHGVVVAGLKLPKLDDQHRV